MIDLNQILNKVLSDSFSDLAHIDITINWMKTKALQPNAKPQYFDALLDVKYYGFFLQRKRIVNAEIRVSPTLEDENTRVLISGIVHELCHIYLDDRCSSWHLLIKYLVLRLSKRLKHKEERKVWLEVLSRGYSGEAEIHLIKFKEEGKTLVGIELSDVKN